MQYLYNATSLRNLRRTIGRNVQTTRSERSISLVKLAEMTGIPLQVLDAYELGKYDIRLHEVLRIACALSIKPERLLEQ